MNTTRPVLALGGVLLMGLTACGSGSATTAGSPSSSTASAPAPTSMSMTPADSGGSTGGDFCTQLRSLVKWQLANADQLDAPAFLAENARRYSALETAAPAEFRDTMAFFAKYAAEPSAQAAEEPGFTDQVKKVTAAIASCHIDPTNP